MVAYVTAMVVGYQIERLIHRTRKRGCHTAHHLQFGASSDRENAERLVERRLHRVPVHKPVPPAPNHGVIQQLHGRRSQILQPRRVETLLCLYPARMGISVLWRTIRIVVFKTIRHIGIVITIPRISVQSAVGIVGVLERSIILVFVQ